MCDLPNDSVFIQLCPATIVADEAPSLLCIALLEGQRRQVKVAEREDHPDHFDVHCAGRPDPAIRPFYPPVVVGV
jgi:hypothetical protein